MAIDIIILLNSAFDLIKGSLILSIPIFVVLYILNYIRKKIASRFSLNWIISCLIITFISFFIFLLLIYFLPTFQSMAEHQLGVIPKYLMPAFDDWAGFYFTKIMKLLFVAVIFTLLSLPFALLGSLVENILLSKFKKMNKAVAFFLAVFAITLLLSALVLYVFYWIPIGMIHLIYFS
ncbi:MAG: hypothetical protein AABW72_00055 [archaeon]